MIKPGDIVEVKPATVMYSSLSTQRVDIARAFKKSATVTVIGTRLGPIHVNNLCQAVTPLWSYVLWSNNGLITLGWVITTALIPKGFISA